jgi:glycosyltransferase involved in cell wall biosynthesis
MNILYNIPDVDKSYGGVYQYSYALLKILTQLPEDFHIYVFSNIPNEELKSIIKTNSRVVLCAVTDYKKGKKALFYYRKKRILKSMGLEIIKSQEEDVYDFLIEKYDINIIHTPFQSYVKRQHIKSITTIHDVQELYFPNFFNSKQRADRAVNYKKAIDHSDAVIVSYDHIKEDIIKYFDKPSSQIFPVLLDMKELWYDQIKETKENLLSKFNLPEGFILYPAATWEHKNHLSLLKALLTEKNRDINLVCTGHKNSFYDDTIVPFIKKNRLEKRVFFLGIVTNEELYQLYHKTRAVVIPTLYEAGSFPLMESILMNIPVICSNVTSLPDTIGDQRFVFDPLNIEVLSDKVEFIYYNEDYRIDNLKVIQDQRDKLKGNNSLLKILSIYHKIRE